MKRFWYFAVMLALILVVSACNKQVQPENPDAAAQVVVSAITGEAQLQHANDGEKQPLAVGQPLVESDIISSGAGALVVITLEDGKEIQIGENTIFALSVIRRDATGNVNILALKQGSIVNIVDTPLAESDVYEVHTPRLVMSVRGTSNYMESNAYSDTVIGITGETHVFSDGGAANVVPGMMAKMNRNTTSPQLLPSSSKSLPPLASNYAEGRGISYDALARDAITQSQQGADGHKPSTQFSNNFAGDLFNDDSISVSGGNSGNASASEAGIASSSDPSAESASSESEADLESSAAAISAVTETAVSSTAPIQPVPVAQAPSSSTAPSSSSKAESSSSVSSGSRNNDSYTSDSSSRRSSSSRDNDSYSSSRSSSSIPSSSSTPPPSSKNIKIVYKDCLNQKADVNVEKPIAVGGDGKFYLTKADLKLPANSYLLASNVFPISVSSVASVDVYVFYCTYNEINIEFDHEGTYMGGPAWTIQITDLLTSECIDINGAFGAVNTYMKVQFPTRDIVGGKLTWNMLSIENGKFCLRVPITSDSAATPGGTGS